jgi:UDP-glucose 4-epimerase
MILITGASGYIGSHAWVELLLSGYDVVGLDNFSNSSPKVLTRIEKITQQKIKFVEVDLSDLASLDLVFSKYEISAVIHFAGFKSVHESVHQPLKYYKNNISGLLNLIEVMRQHQCRNLVFSSSATVYSPQNSIPYVEGMPLSPVNPYGRTKHMIEQILSDIHLSDNHWEIACLRYFNPIGAHATGLIGEDPKGIPNNLMPYISQVAVGKLPALMIYGDDWDTPDGTGVRDYVHVVDVAKAHLKALQHLMDRKGSFTVNLGTGRGYTVLDVVRAFEKVSNQKIPYQFISRRDGDIAKFYADVELAKKVLNWRAEFDLSRMCFDSWRWQMMNPDGYQTII